MICLNHERKRTYLALNLFKVIDFYDKIIDLGEKKIEKLIKPEKPKKKN